jgi:dienelactone hydrolase
LPNRPETSKLRVAAPVVAAAFVSLLSASAGVARTDAPRLVVSPPSALVDEPVDVRVTGLRRGQKVALVATAQDGLGIGWRSRLLFAADGRGRIDTRSQMKLFWSMRPTKKSNADTHAAFAFTRPEMPVLIRALVGGRTVASGVFVRVRQSADLTARDTTLATEGFVGTYYVRPAAPPGPAVLQLGGSAGGHGPYPAALLASHGYRALSLGYFNEPGLPQELRRFPLEYFRSALQWLAAQPGIDPRQLVVFGASYGGQAALLSGAYFPELVHGVITCSGGASAGASVPDQSDAAWSLGGKPVPARSAIPVERIAGPVLAFGGGKDAIADSAEAVREIVSRARAHGRHDIVGHIYPDAGHGVGCRVPNIPVGDEVPGTNVWAGGTPETNASAAVATWPLMLRFLRNLRP